MRLGFPGLRGLPSLKKSEQQVMAVGDLFRCTYRYNVSQQPVTITLGYEHTGSTGSVEEELSSILALGVATEFNALRDLVSQQCTLESALARKLTGDPGAPGRAHATLNRGQLTGQAIPATKSLMVVHKQTVADVRRNGKSYVTGFQESDIEGNIVSDENVVEGVKDIFDNLLTINQSIPDGSATFRQVVLSTPPGQPNQIQGLPVVSNSLRDILFNSARRRTREFGYALDTEVP